MYLSFRLNDTCIQTHHYHIHQVSIVSNSNSKHYENHSEHKTTTKPE
jgi:hypothetical protein